jgi:GNAT superfamily N-acetyltransferase
MPLVIERLKNKAEIYDFLKADRFYAAYAIGDLEPSLFRQCEWHVSSSNGRPIALCLLFRGLQTDRLFLMGSAQGLGAILEGVPGTAKAYFACRASHLGAVRVHYAVRKTQLMSRMVLAPQRFTPVEGSVRRVGPGDVGLLQDLYQGYGDVAFAPYQLEQGVFYGVEKNGRLVATAGTHLLSRTYRLGIVGNVFTHPDHRGQGYAKLCTSAVVEELLSQSLDVVLNVEHGNEPAERIYEGLGFEVYCHFIECLGLRRTSNRRARES